MSDSIGPIATIGESRSTSEKGFLLKVTVLAREPSLSGRHKTCTKGSNNTSQEHG